MTRTTQRYPILIVMKKSDTVEKQYWSDDSKEKKWNDGKGRIRLAWVEFRSRDMIDIRIMRRKDDGYEHTKSGLRLTPNQLRAMLPSLVEMLEHIDNAKEERDRAEAD